MTKAQHEAAKRQATVHYADSQEGLISESAPAAERKRRSQNSAHRTSSYGCGFWTANNLRAYELIYRYYGEHDAVIGF